MDKELNQRLNSEEWGKQIALKVVQMNKAEKYRKRFISTAFVLLIAFMGVLFQEEDLLEENISYGDEIISFFVYGEMDSPTVE